ncbi:unnamed protein product [Notodromas monacha]|uniref:Caveolin n=1 Tax=Notodromas monacha TaxID=399045 RepID=A0A7R9GDK6_9CRUS|nr:unnamed protein product [Notodromas monacha]CAG0917000.1 unnamed protein product [Notodromas monacha]
MGIYSGIDMDNRDPNHLNSHLQVMWDDVIGEPEGISSPDCTWKCSAMLFTMMKQAIYLLLTVIFAPFAACCLGAQFACLSCCHIWCCMPCLRTYKINCAMWKNFYEVWLAATCTPCCESIGRVFSKARVRYQRLPDGDDEEKNVFQV